MVAPKAFSLFLFLFFQPRNILCEKNGFAWFSDGGKVERGPIVAKVRTKEENAKSKERHKEGTSNGVATELHHT
jgi:hypothetical protein